jgi:hypothetical protein
MLPVCPRVSFGENRAISRSVIRHLFGNCACFNARILFASSIPGVGALSVNGIGNFPVGDFKTWPSLPLFNPVAISGEPSNGATAVLSDEITMLRMSHLLAWPVRVDRHSILQNRFRRTQRRCLERESEAVRVARIVPVRGPVGRNEKLLFPRGQRTACNSDRRTPFPFSAWNAFRRGRNLAATATRRLAVRRVPISTRQSSGQRRAKTARPFR